MAIGIEKANHGYSTTGLMDYLKTIDIEVIQKLREKMNETIPQLREKVDEVWAGAAADAFKDKLSKDALEMMKTLDEVKDMVQGELAQIATNFDNGDQAAADFIKSME